MPKYFTEEIETYHVLVLKLDDFHSSAKPLLEGFRFLDLFEYGKFRGQEKKLLQMRFDDWDIPYCHKLAGWRDASPILILTGERLAGGVYLHDRNEFDQNAARGQVHYAFIDPAFQGQGLYSMMFRELVQRAREWGLQELYLNSDRYMLPEVYVRWGAKPWKQITKTSRLPQNQFGKMVAPFYSILRRGRRQVRKMWMDRFDPCK